MWNTHNMKTNTMPEWTENRTLYDVPYFTAYAGKNTTTDCAAWVISLQGLHGLLLSRLAEAAGVTYGTLRTQLSRRRVKLDTQFAIAAAVRRHNKGVVDLCSPQAIIPLDMPTKTRRSKKEVTP